VPPSLSRLETGAKRSKQNIERPNVGQAARYLPELRFLHAVLQTLLQRASALADRPIFQRQR
jgi:hypothetical protein